MPDFINTEHCVEKLFPVGTTFSFEGKKYQVALCGKPRPARGECKTDVYIKGIASDGEAREIKISVKQKNADFLENKMSFDSSFLCRKQVSVNLSRDGWCLSFVETVRSSGILWSSACQVQLDE